MALATRYERSQGRCPVYVGDGWDATLLEPARRWGESVSGSPGWNTCDIVSLLPTGEIDRVIEVKGKARRNPPSSITFPDREYEAAQRLGAHWWLYVGFGCDTPDAEPLLVVVQEPRRLTWDRISPSQVGAGIEHECTWSVMPHEILKLGDRIVLSNEVDSTE